MGQSTDVDCPFSSRFLQTALEIITIPCYNNHKWTVGIRKRAKRHENNRATTQWAEAWTNGKGRGRILPEIPNGGLKAGGCPVRG